MNNKLSPIEKQIILYQTDEGNQSINVLYKDETFWMPQKDIARLFNVSLSTVNRHLSNIFKEGELAKEVVIAKIAITTKHGAIAGKTQHKIINYYNLDAIISVGYRVNSKEATKFRIWATQTLKEYIVKGFVLNDDMLKNGRVTGKDYFDELLERVRSIRASERRIYQKITDIFAECSTDYDSQSPITKNFYAMVQNKFHYAITGQTAAEIIYRKSDHHKKYMGLTTWKNSPDGRVLKSDATVAKNYLSEKEIHQLERAVSSFFDYIENIIERHRSFTMKQFAQSVDKFLAFNEYKILDNKGSISMKQAKEKALKEYSEFNKTQLKSSDFDKFVKEKIPHKH
ncbi:RhuM family protein [Allisonella histaminiformans]|uniref:RhuM family protein n=1 Tax=Allisonella histaminiformans TaxID=209880 RepID=UPI002E75CF46|nr:RhuM family protein [Allisonella histaminiformans]